MSFKSTIFDERKYNQVKASMTEDADKMPAGIAALSAEGLPTDREFIEKITKTPLAFRDYIRSLADEKVGTGFTPADEKARIYTIYNTLLNRINGDIQRMGKAISRGNLPLKDDGDTITVDWEKIDQIAREQATYTINSEGMQSYYDEVVKLKKNIDHFRKFEEKNNLPDFLGKGALYGNAAGSGFKNGMKFDKFFEQGGTPELFQEIMQDYFSEK